MLAALRGVLKHAFALGLVGAEDYERVRPIESIRGGSHPAPALPGGELRALFVDCDASRPGGARNAALLAILYGGGLREWSFHALRHFFISELVRRRVSVEVVRILAGHSKLDVTQRYVHAEASELRAGISVLSGNG